MKETETAKPNRALMKDRFEHIARQVICDSKCETICVWCLNEARKEWSAESV